MKFFHKINYGFVYYNIFNRIKGQGIYTNVYDYMDWINSEIFEKDSYDYYDWVNNQILDYNYEFA